MGGVMGKIAEDGGKRHSIGFRVTAETRDRIAAAAKASGRSIAQELEARFDASLVCDDLRTLIREELRAELRAELRSEIRAAFGEARLVAVEPVEIEDEPRAVQ